MFGDNLKKLRKDKKISQEKLSEELKIAQNTLSQYELNKRQPDYDTLVKIANYFEVSVDYLLDRQDKELLNAFVVAKIKNIAAAELIKAIELLSLKI